MFDTVTVLSSMPLKISVPLERLIKGAFSPGVKGSLNIHHGLMETLNTVLQRRKLQSNVMQTSCCISLIFVIIYQPMSKKNINTKFKISYISIIHVSMAGTTLIN